MDMTYTQKQKDALESVGSNLIVQQDISDNSTSAIDIQYKITRASNTKQSIWQDVVSYTWADLCSIMTNHQEGAKEGSCFTPAIFTATKRKKNDAKQIDLLVFDFDNGESFTQIKAALTKHKYAGIIYSTHSHMQDKGYPCPKFRVIMLLQKPWIANEFKNQTRANNIWAKAIFDIAGKLGLEHDQSGIKGYTQHRYQTRHRNYDIVSMSV